MPLSEDLSKASRGSPARSGTGHDEALTFRISTAAASSRGAIGTVSSCGVAEVRTAVVVLVVGAGEMISVMGLAGLTCCEVATSTEFSKSAVSFNPASLPLLRADDAPPPPRG